jgi:O-antigen/teichoic acid export membrane protein
MLHKLLRRPIDLYRLFHEDSLFRNAVYLMGSTSVMSALGFVFWVFVAHLYKPAQIGEASALIAVTTLLSTLSLLGLNEGLLRFLPKSKDQSRDINAATILVATITLLVSTLYVLVGNRFGGNLTLLASDWHKFAFVILMVTVSLNTLTDAMFIANRKAQYHTVGYTSFALVKLVLPLLLVPFGSLGIFGAYILAVVVSLAVSYYLMWRGCDYHIKAKPNWKLINETKGYATHNYIGGVLAGLPSQLLPLLIIRRLGAASVAYFSMAWMIANLLYVIPSASTQSLLAESSHDPEAQRYFISRTIKMLAKILLPVIAIAVIGAPYVLRIFGPSYAEHGTRIFQFLALSTIFVAGNYIGTTLLNLEKRTSGIIGVQLISIIVTFISAFFLLPYGLSGIGLAMLLGYAVSNVAQAFLYWRHRSEGPPEFDQILQHWAGDYRSPEPSMLLPLLRAYAIVGPISCRVLSDDNGMLDVMVVSGERRVIVRFFNPEQYDDSQITQAIDRIGTLSSPGQQRPLLLRNHNKEFISHTANHTQLISYAVMKYVYDQPATRTQGYLEVRYEVTGGRQQNLATTTIA